MSNPDLRKKLKNYCTAMDAVDRECELILDEWELYAFYDEIYPPSPEYPAACCRELHWSNIFMMAL